MKKTLLMLIFSGLSISVFADYYICYGSFRNQDNAFAESAALQAAGIESAVVEIKTDGAVLYRVIHPKGYADSDSAKWKIKYIVAELESPYPTQESFWVFESVDAPKTVVQTDAAVKEAAEMNDDLSVDAASGVELTDESAVEETNEVIAEETADGEISENSDEAVAADSESSNENVTEISNNEQSGNSSADGEESEEEIAQRVRRDAFAEKTSDKFDVEGAEEAADGEVSEELTVEESDEALAEEAADGEVSEELTVEESDETLAEEAADGEVSEELTVEEGDETLAEEGGKAAVSEIRFTLKNQSVYKTLFDSPATVYAVIPEELTRGKVPVDFTVNLYRDRERVASKTGDFIPNLNKFSITETFPEAMFNDVTRTCEYTIELIFNGEVIAENSYLYFID